LLPGDKIAVLYSQRRERWLFALDKGLVGRPQLALDHAARPAVSEDVMNRGDQNVVFGGDANQSRPEERSADEIKRRARFLTNQFLQLNLSFNLRQIWQSADLERKFLAGGHDLREFSVHFVEGSAQSLVAVDQQLQASLQDVRCDWSRQPHA